MKRVQGPRAAVGARAHQARGELRHDLCHGGTTLAQVDARLGDALTEEAADGRLVVIDTLVAVLHGTTRGHAEVLLEQGSLLVALDLSGGLVSTREHRTTHHAGRTRGEVERGIARLADCTVGPDVLATLARSSGTLENRGEARPAHAGLDPGGAHGARPDVDLDDVGACLQQEFGVSASADRTSDDRDIRSDGAPNRLDRVEHLLLGTVCGVDQERVSAQIDGELRPLRRITVDPDRHSDLESTLRVE